MPGDTIYAITDDDGFESEALSLFAFQSRNCAPYREYIASVGINPSDVSSVKEIPFLPIEFFKTHKVYCGEGDSQMVFTSSSTSGQGSSRHYMASLSDYEQAFRKAFSLFYGAPENMAIYALLPSYLEREGSSLIYMADNLIGSGGGGFYLDDHDRLIKDMEHDPKPKILLGVSYALWDLAEKYAPKLTDTIVMETGGMKGRREEMPKEEFHTMLCKAFGVSKIHSEYGMAELTSQAYSSGKGIFTTPPWMRVMARDLNDPFDILPAGRSGGINIIDLANRYSCAFIQTQDIGVVYGASKNNSVFSILGRAERSEIRGCNLLIQ